MISKTVLAPRQGHVMGLCKVNNQSKIVLFWGGNHGLLNGFFEMQDYEWKQVKVQVEKGIVPKASCAVCYNEECMYIYGGMEQDWISGDLLMYDARNRTLDKIKPYGRFLPPSLLGASMIFQPKDQGYLWLFGGMDASHRHQRTVWRFSLETKQWDKIRTTGINPIPRESHTACYYKNTKGEDLMVVYGGFYIQLQSGNADVKRDVLYLNLSTWEWTTARFSGYYQIARSFHSASIYKDKMYCFGGYVRVGNDEDHVWERSNELFCFHLTTETWELLDPQFGEPKCGHRSVIVFKFD